MSNSARIILNSSRRCLTTKTQQQVICNKAVSDAEKLIGYPTSFLSLRWLLNDEVANVAFHIRKLIGSKHPLLETARTLLMRKEVVPPWGLIVLLISKAGGAKGFSLIEKDVTAGVLHSQRVLAEVCEMIRTSNIIHKSLLNIDNIQEADPDINFGNKLALLSGDYLLSTSFREVAQLKHQEVNELISSSLRDLVEAEYLDPRDKQNCPLPSKPLSSQKPVTVPDEYGTAPFKISEVLGNTEPEWVLRHFLGGVCILAKCCQATLMLAGQSSDIQKQGYLLGRNLGLAWQAYVDYEEFCLDKSGPFSFISAPFMFHLQEDESLYKYVEEAIENVDRVDFDSIRKLVSKGPGMERTLELQNKLAKEAIRALEPFHDSQAKSALVNIIQAI